MRYKLQSSQPLTKSVQLLTFAPVDRTINFEPGQYAAIQFTQNGKPTPARCFSIVNTPNADGALQFAMRVSGNFTTSLASLAIGSKVTIYGSFGSFVYTPSFDTSSVFVAGGIGITPIKSMLQSAVPTNPNNLFTLIYSVRDQADIPFLLELSELEQHNSNLRVVYVVTKGSAEKLAGKRVIPGLVTAELLASAARNDFIDTSFFICGPSTFSDLVTSFLDDKQTHATRIYSESFSRISYEANTNWFTRLFGKLSPVYGLTAVALVVSMSVVTVSALSASSDKSATTSSTATDTQSSTATTTPDDSSTQTTTTDTSTPTSSDTTSATTDNSAAQNRTTTTPTTQTTTPTYTQPVSQQS